jgi:hypothetical protein
MSTSTAPQPSDDQPVDLRTNQGGVAGNMGTTNNEGTTDNKGTDKTLFVTKSSFAWGVDPTLSPFPPPATRAFG